MKVSCQSCGSKYTIADDKVRGRRVKVRCKSCGTPIVVDGNQLEADLAAAAIAPSDDDEATRIMSAPAGFAGEAPPPEDSWMVNLSDTDQRNMTTEEIVEGWQDGLVREDTFVWRDGMDDWVPVFDAPEIRQAIDATETAVAPPAAAAMPAAQAPTSVRTAGHDLFGNIDQAGSELDPSHGSAPAAAAAMSYAEAAEEKPTGARNENSVLFSLDALKAGFTETAQKTPGPKAPPPQRPGSSSDLFGMGSGGGFGGGGSNALFGMDANAALLTAPAPEPEPPPPPPSPASTYSPMTMSPAQGRGGVNKLVVGLGAGLAVLVVVVIALAVALSSSSDDEATAKNDSSEKAEKTARSSDDEKKDEEAKGDEKKDEEAKADDEKKDEEAKADDEKKAEEKPPANASPAAQKAYAAAAAKRKQEAAAAKKTEPAPKKEDSAPKVKEEKSSGVASFNKGAAISALSVAAAQASGCKRPDGPTGTGRAIVTFAPSGNVMSASVTGPFAGSSVGGCVAGVFRRARVPPFSGNAVTVSKSFTISP